MSIVGEIQVVTHQKGWADLAVCKETDPEAFYVEKGGNTKPAKDTCARCPVTAECLEYALAHASVTGFGVVSLNVSAAS